MKVNKKTFMLVLSIALIILIALAAFWIIKPKTGYSDRCTEKDRQINNCVPAGRCTPPGHPMAQFESTIDCPITDYDRKFNTDL